MRLGFGVLRLSSETFWRMTPRELKLAADGVFGRGGATTRTALDVLMRDFPDERDHGARPHLFDSSGT